MAQMKKGLKNKKILKQSKRFKKSVHVKKKLARKKEQKKVEKERTLKAQAQAQTANATNAASATIVLPKNNAGTPLKKLVPPKADSQSEKARKRVSFANKLTESSNSPAAKARRLSAQQSQEQENAETTPQSILKTKQKQLAGSTEGKKPKKTTKKLIGNEPNLEEGNEEEMVEKKDESGGLEGAFKDKKRKTRLLVPRSAKEKLKVMDRKERKEFLRELKAKRRPYMELAKKTKKLWEQVRSSKIKESDKEKAIQQLRDLVKGQAAKLVFAHDTVRVIQCLMALDRAEIRAELFEELKSYVILMSKSKYARFFVIKMLKYGTKVQREEVIRSFHGHVPELMKNTYGAEVLEYAYNEFANMNQRSAIVGEFYGAEYQKFKAGRILKVSDLIVEDPLKKPFILRNLKDMLLSLAGKAAFKHSLTNRLLAEYLTHCTDVDARSEMIDAVKERLMEIAHTRDGALSVLQCIWGSNAKDRKAVVKNTKGLVPKLAKEEYGHWVLLGLFDCMDDTVLIKKTVIKEITDKLHDVATSKYGLKVLHYLILKRNPRIFNKEIVEMLAQGDSNSHSKKDPEVRRVELLRFVAPQIVRYLSIRMSEFIFESKTALFILSVMQNTVPGPNLENEKDEIAEAKKSCFEVLGDLAEEEFIPCNLEGRLHLVEHPQGNFVLNFMLKLDPALHESGESTLSEVFVDKVGAKKMGAWTSCNKGCYVLLGMLNSGVDSVVKRVEEIIEKNEKKLKGYSFPAAELLLKRKVKKDDDDNERIDERIAER